MDMHFALYIVTHFICTSIRNSVPKDLFFRPYMHTNHVNFQIFMFVSSLKVTLVENGQFCL